MAVADDPDAMVAIAILVSRVEALALANMLEAAGIQVFASGIHHASVEVISLGLGGHRICVPASQAAAASEVLRESGHIDAWEASDGLSRAVLRFVGVWTGVNGALLALGVAVGAFPASILLSLPFYALSVPVNPQGRGDYFLVKADA